MALHMEAFLRLLLTSGKNDSILIYMFGNIRYEKEEEKCRM